MAHKVLGIQSGEKHRKIENQIGVGLTFVLYAENKGTLLLGKNISVMGFLPQSNISSIFSYTFLSPLLLLKETIFRSKEISGDNIVVQRLYLEVRRSKSSKSHTR